MIRTHLHSRLGGALASVAALLLSSGALAQSNAATAPAKDNAAAAAQQPASSDKPATGGKVDPKGNAASKVVDPVAKEAERAARAKAEHDAERQQLRTALRGPMTDALKEDLRHHAERVAKLERIRALALDAKDSATVDRANKLLEKENAHYDKWMSSLSTKTEPTVNPQAKTGAQ